MSNLLVIVICLAAGLILQRLRHLPDNAAQVLNQYVICVALPALVLAELPKLRIDANVIIPLGSSWAAMTVSVILVLILARFCNWSRDVKAVLLLLVPLGNTSFVGFPLVEALLGERGLGYAIIYDQLGSFIAISSYGMFVLAYYSGGALTAKDLIKKLLTFPPFIAVLIAASFIGRQYPEWLYQPLSRIGESLVPAVMVAVGLQWRLRLAMEDLLPLSLALALKLAIAPALLWSAFAAIGVNGLASHVSILEAAMPSMITAGALAVSHNLAPRLASSIVGYGLLLSLVTVPFWAWLIS